MAEEIKLEKNIPIPIARSSKFAQILLTMELNDSFLIPCEEYASIKNAIQFFRAKNRGQRFATRLMHDSSQYRIWRIE